MKLSRTDDGWDMLANSGGLICSKSEVCFVADLKHEIAIFSGSREYVQEVTERIKKKCKELGAEEDARDNLFVICVGEEVDESEGIYMLDNYRLPRRVSIRLRNGVCTSR
jgi:hypothetical protein